jgi:uncharacterized protein (DUF1778 family)
MSVTVDTSDVHIHLRARAQDRALIDQAAELSGLNRSQFMLDASLRDAKAVLADQTTVLADQKAFQAILAWMDSPATETERAGMQRIAKVGVAHG